MLPHRLGSLFLAPSLGGFRGFAAAVHEQGCPPTVIKPSYIKHGYHQSPHMSSVFLVTFWAANCQVLYVSRSCCNTVTVLSSDRHRMSCLHYATAFPSFGTHAGDGNTGVLWRLSIARGNLHVIASSLEGSTVHIAGPSPGQWGFGNVLGSAHRPGGDLCKSTPPKAI